MAEVINSVEGDDLKQFISTDNAVTWKAIVCLTQNGLSSSDNSTETQTKCGTFVSTGTGTHQFTGSGLMNTDPEANEVSYMDLWTLKNAGNSFLIVEKNTAETIFTMGTGTITDLSSDASSGGPATFTYTIKVSGSISLAEGS